MQHARVATTRPSGIASARASMRAGTVRMHVEHFAAAGMEERNIAARDDWERDKVFEYLNLRWGRRRHIYRESGGHLVKERRRARNKAVLALTLRWQRSANRSNN